MTVPHDTSMPKSITSDTSQDAALVVDGLSQVFQSVTALDQLSFEARDREFLTIVGPSGCGKSTTLRLIAGLNTPTGGLITVHGQTVKGPVPGAAMVFQSPVLLPWRRTMDNILFTAEMRGLNPDTYRKQAQVLLQLAGLETFENSFPHELSGGMQQRVSICRALLLDPTLLLMDEPFGALDVITRENLGFRLQRIWMETMNTVVFVTHSITEAVLLSDRVIIMSPRPGRVQATIDIDLPRPRTTAMLQDSRFLELSVVIRKEMETEWSE